MPKYNTNTIQQSHSNPRTTPPPQTVLYPHVEDHVYGLHKLHHESGRLGSLDLVARRARLVILHFLVKLLRGLLLWGLFGGLGLPLLVQPSWPLLRAQLSLHVVWPRWWWRLLLLWLLWRALGWGYMLARMS